MLCAEKVNYGFDPRISSRAINFSDWSTPQLTAVILHRVLQQEQSRTISLPSGSVNCTRFVMRWLSDVDSCRGYNRYHGTVFRSRGFIF